MNLCIVETSDYGDYEEPQKNCSLEVSIKGGNVSYSNEGLEGSVLTYHCKAGHYPFPAMQRVCDRDGQWSAMRLPNGKRTLNAVCKGTFFLYIHTYALFYSLLNPGSSFFLTL